MVKAKALDLEVTNERLVVTDAWWAGVFTWRQGSWDGTGVFQRQTNTQPHCHLGERPSLALRLICQSSVCRFV